MSRTHSTRSMIRQRLGVMVLFWSIALPFCHAEEATPSEAYYLQDFPVLLTASRLRQPQSDIPNAATVIDRAMIIASGFRHLADLFRLVPGMYVGYADGHTPIVAYHGSTDKYARRMQVMIDGRSVYLPPYGGVDWEDLPLQIDDIDSIEVIRGPAAASHGENSLQGVINIRTRDAASVQGMKVSVARDSGGESAIAAHLGQSISPVLDYRLSLESRRSAGYGTPVWHDASHTRLATVRANYHPTNNDSLDVQLGMNEGARDLGILGRTTEPFRTAQTHSDFQQLNWLHTQPSGDELKVSYYHLYRAYQDNSAQAIDLESNQVQRRDLELQHTLQLGAKNRLVWGAGWRYDSVQSPLNFGVPYLSTHQLRAFAHDEWRITPQAVFNLGTMIEQDGLGHTDQSPRLSLNYHLSPEQTLRIGASIAYRSPVLVEDFSNTQYKVGRQYRAVGGLRPERMMSREIGYLAEFPAQHLSLDARGYLDQVSDLIFIDPLTTGTSFKNLYAATYKGLEATLKYHPSPDSQLTFNAAHQFVSAAATAGMTQAKFNPALQAYVQQFPLTVPRNSASLLFAQQLSPTLQWSTGYYYQGVVQLLDAAQAQTVQRRWDVRLARSFGVKDKAGSGEVAAVVHNLLKNAYSEYANTTATKNIFNQRRAEFTATLSF
jgi:iron complex outermembrane recepter protein